MPKKIGNVELHMGPHGAPGGPDDLQKVIVDFIRGAKKKLDIAVQELDSRPIADAVIEARQRRVRVRLVLEASYLTESRGRADPRVPGGSHEINRVLHDEILRSAIHVRSDFNPKIFHQKFIIRDGSAVLTGSTNFTETGVEKNLNHVVVVRDRKVANIYTKEFKEIQQGHFGKLSEGHDDVPRDVTVSKLPIRVLFAPDHSPRWRS